MNVLVAYSGTKESKAALTYARQQAAVWGATLFIVSSSEGGKGEKPEEISRMEAELEDIKAALEKEDIPCTVEQLARGFSPGEDILLYADENEIDHIVVGIRKKSRTSKLILGSTAQYIILKAKCPVTSVK